MQGGLDGCLGLSHSVTSTFTCVPNTVIAWSCGASVLNRGSKKKRPFVTLFCFDKGIFCHVWVKTFIELLWCTFFLFCPQTFKVHSKKVAVNLFKADSKNKLNLAHFVRPEVFPTNGFLTSTFSIRPFRMRL